MLRKNVYDPIYNKIVLPAKNPIGASSASRLLIAGKTSSTKVDNAIQSLLDCEIFSRLNYLYQSGVAWLVFPSATHTRYAHSIGCYHLGKMALEKVYVLEKNSLSNIPGEVDQTEVLKFQSWLNKKYKIRSNVNTQVKDEYFTAIFLASLLCHDAGHFPFSHTLEMNYEIDLPLSHEEHFFQLADKHSIHDYFESIKSPYNHENVTKKNYLISAMRYLISGYKDEYLLPQDFPDEYLLILNIFKRFVSGLIDLDRIDHYLRDSFFSGAKLANFNIDYLLGGITIIVGKNNSDFTIYLDRDAFTQAKSLLNSKHLLSDAVFENQDLINFEVLLNSSVSSLIKDDGIDINDLIYLKDNELIELLKQSPTQKYINRFLLQKPLFFCGRFVIISDFKVSIHKNRNLYLDLSNDHETISAYEKMLKHIFGINLNCGKESFEKIANTNEIILFVKDLLSDKQVDTAIQKELEKVPDPNLSVLQFLTLLLLSSTNSISKGQIVQTLMDIGEEEFIQMKMGIFNLIGKKKTKKIFSLLKKRFAKNLKKKIKDLGYEKEVFIKFGKKFLNFYDFPGDVKEFLNVQVEGMNKSIIDDPVERNYLTTYATYAIRSRFYVWLFLEDEPNRGILEKIKKELDKIGFYFNRGY